MRYKNVYPPPPLTVVMLAGSVALGFSSQSFAGEGVVSIRAIFSLLLDARDLGRTVYLRITDNPVYNAFPGRCSIMSVAK